MGTSVKHLVSTVYWEARIILEMVRNESFIVLDYKPHNQDYKQLMEAFKHAIFVKFPAEVIGKTVTIQNRLGEEKTGIVYSESYFLRCTLFNYMVQDIAADLNQAHVLNYLKTIDFDLISLKKETNVHNNRKNVWMIKLKKK